VRFMSGSSWFSRWSVKLWGRNEKAGSPAKARCVKRAGIT